MDDKDDLPALVSQAQQALGLHPSKITAGPDGTEAVKRILGGLITVTSGLSELRNRGYGTGHGDGGTTCPSPPQARSPCCERSGYMVPTHVGHAVGP